MPPSLVDTETGTLSATGHTGDTTPPTPTASTADTGPVVTTADTTDTGPVLASHIILEAFQGGETGVGGTLFILDGQALGYSLVAGTIYHGWSAWWTAQDLLGISPDPGWKLNLGSILNVGDVTGDGVGDLALYRYDASGPFIYTHGLVPGPLSSYPPSTIFGELGPPGGTYRPVTAAYDLAEPVACGDVSGDGVADLCGRRGVDYGSPDGVQDVTFSPQLSSEALPVGGLDLDQNGQDEIYWFQGTEIHRVSPTTGTTETVAVPTWAGAASVHVIAPVDLGGGPVLLVAIGTELCTIDGAQFDAGGCTTLPVPGSSVVSSLAAGDFDGDGIIEIAVGHRNLPHRVDIHDQSGLLRRTLTGVDPTDNFGTGMVAGDLHLDGISDLLISEPIDGFSMLGQVHYYRDPLVGY